MAISHICQSCGFDLAATRPIHDPYFRLPVVICPKCDTAAVRMRHPFQQMWRTVMRYDTIATAFAIHLSLLVASVLATIGFCFAVPIAITSVAVEAITLRELVPAIVLSALFPPALGAWLTAGFSHIARWRVFIGWGLSAVATLTIVVFFGLLANGEFPRPGNPIMQSGDTWRTALLIAGGFWSVSVIIIAAITTLATSGIPLGFGLLALARTFRSWRFRLRRRRLRKRRFL